MSNENKEKICEILKQEIDNEVNSLNELKSLQPSKTFFEKQQKLSHRRAKYFIDFCK